MKSLIKSGVCEDKLRAHNLYILIFYIDEKLILFTVPSLEQFFIVAHNYK